VELSQQVLELQFRHPLDGATGDKKKGFSIGHATWNQTNHIEHAFGDFSPFVDAGSATPSWTRDIFTGPLPRTGTTRNLTAVLNTIRANSVFLSRPTTSPWGNQTEISRAFRCGSARSAAEAAASTNRKGYTSAASRRFCGLTRDNGYNAGIDYKPVGYLDLEFDFSRSIPLQLNSYSFGIGVDLSWLLRPHAH